MRVDRTEEPTAAISQLTGAAESGPAAPVPAESSWPVPVPAAATLPVPPVPESSCQQDPPKGGLFHLQEDLVRKLSLPVVVRK